MHIFHTWSSWADMERRTQNIIDREVARAFNFDPSKIPESAVLSGRVSVRQERRCTICRKLEMREVEA